MSDVRKRYSVSAPHLREVLQGAEDAIARAKQAVSMESSSAAKKATSSQKKAVSKKGCGKCP